MTGPIPTSTPRRTAARTTRRITRVVAVTGFVPLALAASTAPAGTVDVANRSISFDLTEFGATDGVSITIYDFRGH